MIWFHRKKGFTLLELMIVVIIIGILATLALPRFLKAAERARWAAAASTLGTIRSAQMRYYSQYTKYATKMSDLDVEIPSTSSWQANDLTETELTDGKVIGKVTCTSVSPQKVYTIAADGTISVTDATTPTSKQE